jgi:hypothetical protein
MAQENLGINITVGGNQDQALGSLKKQLREATQEVAALSDKFGATSQQAVAAAKRASELKDRIGDAKSLVDAFNPDAKFKALTSSLSGVAGGFAAAQGAIALFGVESKEVEQALLKVQSAMALSQGLQAVGESIDSFKQLGAVIKNSTVFLKANEMANKAAAFTMKLFNVSVETTSTSFKVLKGAIAATGLGLLVVAIGEIVAAFQEYSSAAEKAAEKQKELNDTITKGAKTALKGEQDFLANQEKLDLARAKSRGASEQEIFNIEQSYRKRKAEAQIRFWQETKNADAEGASAAAGEVEKINTEAQVAQLEFQTKQAEARRAAAKAANDEAAELEAARLQKIIDDEKKLTEELLTEYDKRRNIANNAKILSQKELNALDEEDRIKKEEEENKKFNAQIDLLGKTKNFTLELIKNNQETNAKLKADNDAARQAELTSRLAFASSVAMAIGELNGLFEQGTAASKVAGLAQIAINTGVGFAQGLSIAQQSAKATGPAAAFAFPIFYATQVAAVLAAASKAKTILSQVKGGGAGGSVTAPSIQQQAPISPAQPQAQTTNISTQSINALGNQAIRTYVIESDVTSSQQRIAAIQQRARFG